MINVMEKYSGIRESAGPSWVAIEGNQVVSIGFIEMLRSR
jgi:hypothetical protein